MSLSLSLYIYIYTDISHTYTHVTHVTHVTHAYAHTYIYGQFSKFHACFCGLDSGNLKFETVRTHKQHICF